MKYFDDRVYKITDILLKHGCKLPFDCIVDLSYLLEKKELEK